MRARPAMTKTSETSQPPPLYSLQYRTAKTVVDLGNGIRIGGDEIVIIAGPCAVESYEQTLKTAKHVKKSR